MDKYRVLKQYFGYDSFRPGQEKIIDSLLCERDAFGIMPTGGGKSLCYQIPALMLPGVTFVVSPLISLMKDQVMQLKEQGVAAAYINSTLTEEQLSAVYRNLYSGKYKIIYVAPERLETEGFRHAARNLDISLFAVDEAHCISQWGQDFRPSYLRIPEFLGSLGKRPVVAAFTATATEKVRNDIEESLGLVSPVKVVTSFDRPNLSFDVIRPKNRPSAIVDLVRERKGKSGIVYCSTRKNVEKICERLCDAGIAATRYHAGLEDSERAGNQEDFLYDRKPVMVATNAFGMGINKSNVNYVIHFNMPKSLEEYYQEAGRAGRDGENAECILLYGKSDILMAKRLIANGTDGLSDTELWESFPKEMERLSTMVDYCETSACFRGRILDYFGETHSEACGNCGNCKGEYEDRDITVDAQKVLSCIGRIYKFKGYHLGKAMVIGTLRGRKSGKLFDYGLDGISTYGIMKDEKQEYVDRVFDFLCSRGYIRLVGEYNTAEITVLANAVLFDGEKVMMPVRKKVKAELAGKDEKISKSEKRGHTPVGCVDEELYEELRKLRQEIAAGEQMPAYIVFTNAALADMAARKPADMDEFLEVSGVGKTKADKYGRIFLDCIADHVDRCSEEDLTYKTDADRSVAEIKKRDAAKALDKLWNAPSSEKKENVATPNDTKKQTSSGREATSNLRIDFGTLLFEANRMLTDYGERVVGSPVKATVMLASSGQAYGCITEGTSKGLSSEETKLLGRMSKEYDTRVVKIVTLWQGGNVFGTNGMLLKRLWELERKNSATEILVAKTTGYCYDGKFIQEDYNIKLLKEFL